MVELAGVEPASEKAVAKVPTSVASVNISLERWPEARHLSRYPIYVLMISQTEKTNQAAEK
jgi:hypothetical protein